MKNVLCITVSILLSFSCLAQFQYPETKTADSSSTYFGTVYKDPYRWLENFKDPTVVDWFKAQANLTNAQLNKLNGRDELIAEWKMLDKLQPAIISSSVYEGGKVFYRKRMPGEKVGKLYYREGLNGTEVLLFDPTTYITGKTLTIESILPSFDGHKIAISYSEQGAEVSHIKIMDVATRKFLKEDLYPTSGTFSWTYDNRSILYSWIKSADNADPLSRLNSKTKLHTLNQDSKTDQDFFSNGSYPELKIDPSVYPAAFVSDDSKEYVFSGLFSVQPEYVVYYAPVSSFYSGKIKWKVLASAEDKLVRGLETIGDRVFAISYDGAPNYKLVETNMKNVDWKHAKVIAAEKKDQTLEAITHTKDYVIISYNDGINSHVYKYSLLNGQTTALQLPFDGTMGVTCLDNKTNNITVGITSWNRPYTEYEVDASTGAVKPGLFNKAPVYPAAYRELQVKEVEVKGHDGVMIPLSIIYRKGTKLDGNNVCLMDSYGAYGISASPYFSTRENSLAVKGVVIAIPHVRGGSEKGDSWYKAGFKTTKPNTWKDFNSCAEYLIAQGYTKASKLAGTGTSAGGILISRAITERPDLYAAAICNVGCANSMRLEFTSNGPVNVPEFGTVKDSIECRALYEMDGVAHVVPGTKYPAVIGIGGWNDPRVIAWETGKFIAALQNATSSGKPVFMKVNYDNGHFTEDKNVTFANFADQYAFAMWQCGHPDFQIKL
jgi:prolyl oligopeptidase